MQLSMFLHTSSHMCLQCPRLTCSSGRVFLDRYPGFLSCLCWLSLPWPWPLLSLGHNSSAEHAWLPRLGLRLLSIPKRLAPYTVLNAMAALSSHASPASPRHCLPRSLTTQHSKMVESTGFGSDSVGPNPDHLTYLLVFCVSFLLCKMPIIILLTSHVQWEGYISTMVKSINSGPRLPGFTPQLYRFLAKGSWKSALALLASVGSPVKWESYSTCIRVVVGIKWLTSTMHLK